MILELTGKTKQEIERRVTAKGRALSSTIEFYRPGIEKETGYELSAFMGTLLILSERGKKSYQWITERGNKYATSGYKGAIIEEFKSKTEAIKTIVDKSNKRKIYDTNNPNGIGGSE